MQSSTRYADVGSTPGQQMQDPEAGDALVQFSTKRSSASMS
jgi:hypothetical protein